MKFPVELLDKIVIFSEDCTVAETLRDYISVYAYTRIVKNILIYGEVQSGKTRAILDVLKNSEMAHLKKILVVQNSLCVLNQYKQRLDQEKIDYQIIDSDTRDIYANTLVLINNLHRYNMLYMWFSEQTPYVLILDEADSTINSCPLRNAVRNYYVTATPFNLTKKIDIHKIINLEPPKNYIGFGKVQFNFDMSEENFQSDIVRKCLKEKNGMILINENNRIEEMNFTAHKLSREFPDIPIVVLNSVKYMLLKNKKKHINQNAISKIIDGLHEYSHIIFIADRCANRGLSYTSSDYTRHLTCQITKLKWSVTSFLQTMRIFGVYNDSPNLCVYMRSEYEGDFKKYKKYIENFKVENLLSL